VLLLLLLLPAREFTFKGQPGSATEQRPCVLLCPGTLTLVGVRAVNLEEGRVGLSSGARRELQHEDRRVLLLDLNHLAMSALPPNSASFTSHPNVHFDTATGKWTFESPETGEELEFDDRAKAWVPVVRPTCLSLCPCV
jgi:hypothetical protein